MTRRSPLTTLGIFFVVLLLAACSVSGGDDDDDAAPTATADAPPPTATNAPSPTETPEPTATPTATLTATPEPTPTNTATPTPSPTPTATPFPEIDTPFGNLSQPDQVLENYTLSYTGEFATAADAVESIEIMIEQSSPTRYHVRTGAGVEIWVIEDQTYFRNPDGSVFPIESAVDPVLISPAAYLIQIPAPAAVPEALEIGREDVEGRPAVHYRVDAAYVALFGPTDQQAIEDPEGQIDVWVDDELGFISRMEMDVEWTDENGERRSATSRYLVSNVGGTAEIQPPV